MGGEGEDLAVEFLKKKGFHILERNYRCRLGEVDIIAQKAGKIFFVEVKTRRSRESVSPLELLSRAKQRHISRVAQNYISVRKCHDTAADFSLLFVDYSHPNPVCELIESAFDLAWGY